MAAAKKTSGSKFYLDRFGNKHEITEKTPKPAEKPKSATPSE